MTGVNTEGRWTQAVDADLYDDMRRWRRHLHANPELGLEEHETTAFIRSLLEEWGLPYSTPLSTATIARIKGKTPGPVLVIRADIDALPIQEESPVSYASTKPGLMHACGHDGHTTILLALAKSLSQHIPDGARGEVWLLFQPGEELADGGAKKLVEANALEGATAVVGLHLQSTLETGVIGLTDGPLMASDDRFDVKIVGSGGHAGLPHLSRDAVVVAAGLVSDLQTLISRRTDPLSSAVVTVGSFHAGEAYNAIPGTAELSGTIRTLTSETRQRLEEEFLSLVTGYASAHGATAQVNYLRGCPPLINDSSAVRFVRPAAETAVGPERVVPMKPMMGAEDFAFYGRLMPSVFAFIGASNGTGFPLHHPQFDINEEALTVGFQFLTQIVERWMDPQTPDSEYPRRQ